MTSNFTRNDYLSWYLPRLRQSGEQTINLHASGVAAVMPAELEIGFDGNPYEMADRYEAALGRWLGIPPREVLFAPGATGGSLLGLLALASPGDELVIEQPVYEPMLRQAECLGPVKRLVRRIGDGWRLPLDEAETLITERTGLVMITEPHNPGGALSAREEVEALARLAAVHGAVLVVNEVYRGFGESDSYHGLADNVVVVSSLSKLFGSYWARVGWISAGADLIQRLRMAHFNLGMGSAPGAAAGLAFMAEADQRRDEARRKATVHLPTVSAWVEATDGISWQPPRGPGFGCIALPDGTDDVALAERLLTDHGVLLVPGTWFETPGTIRLSWLEAGDRLEEGLAQVAMSIP